MDNKVSLAIIVCSLMLFSIFTVTSAQAFEHQWSGDSASSACYKYEPNPEPPSGDNDCDGDIKGDESEHEQSSDDNTISDGAENEQSSDDNTISDGTENEQSLDEGLNIDSTSNENSDTNADVVNEIIPKPAKKKHDRGESYIIGYFAEPWTNIKTRENIYVHNPRANEFKQITLKKDEHDIEQLSFTSETNRKNLRFMIEALNDRSKYVDESAPEDVYSYFNLRINTNECNANECKVKECEIQFGVSEEWMADNSIAEVTLMYYDKGWIELPTTKVGEYEYIGQIDNFGQFAIIGE